MQETPLNGVCEFLFCFHCTDRTDSAAKSCEILRLFPSYASIATVISGILPSYRYPRMYPTL